MARYRKSIRKLARNTGGTLDGYPKTHNLRRPYPSGQHGQARKKKSEYALQLMEKQKVRRTYGVQEKQFVKYYGYAVRKKGVTGTILLQRLESRLDNIVYRAGFGYSRPQARQLVSHGHVEVNGTRVDVPSYIMKPGDVVSVREKSKKVVQTNTEGYAPVIPGWLTVDGDKLTAKFESIPERLDIDPEINEQLIIEFYSR